MLDHRRPTPLDLFAQARSGELPDALSTLGLLATGRRGFLVSGGHALRGDEDNAPLIAGDGREIAGPPDTEVLEDRTLSRFGVQFVSVPRYAAPPDASRLASGAVALRLGLLARSLDMACRHLDGRQSFGQRTLRHQLVKGCVSETHGLVSMVLEECRIRHAEGGSADMRFTQSAITEQFVRVSKLMGGHGYLETGNNGLEYVAALVLAVYAPAEQRAAAEHLGWPSAAPIAAAS